MEYKSRRCFVGWRCAIHGGQLVFVGMGQFKSCDQSCWWIRGVGRIDVKPFLEAFPWLRSTPKMNNQDVVAWTKAGVDRNMTAQEHSALLVRFSPPYMLANSDASNVYNFVVSHHSRWLWVSPFACPFASDRLVCNVCLWLLARAWTHGEKRANENETYFSPRATNKEWRIFFPPPPFMNTMACPLCMSPWHVGAQGWHFVAAFRAGTNFSALFVARLKIDWKHWSPSVQFSALQTSCAHEWKRDSCLLGCREVESQHPHWQMLDKRIDHWTNMTIFATVPTVMAIEIFPVGVLTTVANGCTW